MRAGLSAFLDAALDPAFRRVVVLDSVSVLQHQMWDGGAEPAELPMLRNVLGPLVASDRFPAASVESLVYMTLGGLYGAALYIARSAEPATARADAEVVLDAVLTGLRAQLEANPAVGAAEAPYARSMTVDQDEDLAGLQLAGRAVAEARDAMLAAARPGVSTADLDAVGREVLDRHGAQPAPPTVGFPAATCVSLTGEAAHGIPTPDRVLADGDLLNVDVSAELHGYWADTGASAAVGRVSPTARRLLDATRLANRDALAAARAGEPLRHIGRAVQRRARRHGFSVIQNLNGHGTGRNLWEQPSVPGWEDIRDRTHRSGRASCWPSSRSCPTGRRGPTRPTTAGRSSRPAT